MIITGLLTFAMRFIMLSGVAPGSLPESFKGALDFIPISVLTAIIVPAVFVDDSNNIVFLNNAHLPAAIAAVATAIISRSVVLTIGVGLSTIWLLTFLGFSESSANVALISSQIIF